MKIRKIIRIKSFIRFLKKNKLYTFIEVFGLSVSLMFVTLIGVFTTQELSTDNFQRDTDRLYFMANQEDFGSAYRLANHIKKMYPEVEEVCTMMSNYKNFPTSISEKKLNADLLFTEPSFFEMLTFRIKAGDSQTPLSTRNSAVISESFARKAFPDKDPLGQPIRLNDSVVLTVNAVMEDIRNSVIPYGDILLRMENMKYWSEGLVSEEFHQYGTVPILIRAQKGADLKAKEKDLLEYLKKNVWAYKDGMCTTVSFIPFRDVYFSDIQGYHGHLLNQGNKTFMLILLSVGALILIFAIINYVNLTVAQTGFRAKEMATRRLLGSSRKDLFLRLMVESTLITFISFLLGLFLAFLVVPYANNLLETKIDLVGIISPQTITIILITIVLISSISGFLPAVIISNAKPIEVVKGTFRQKTKMVFSKFFITFQNAITIALMTASLVMVLQINYMIKAPLGYNTTNIIDVYVGNLDNKQTILTLGNEFKQLASVKHVAFGQGMPFNAGNNYTYTKDGRAISFQSFIGDSTYFQMLGFEILRENNVASGNAFYLSTRAFRELELQEDTAFFTLAPFFGGDPLPIAGVVKDFQLGNILNEPRPLLLRRRKVEDFKPWDIAIEIAGDPHRTFNEIKNIYEQITGLEFHGMFIDQQIAKSFTMQRKISQIVMVFTGIAILLSLLGLIAMSSYYIQQRSREIAIRKVFGSSISQALKKLILNFLIYVVIAFIIVTPIIWYIMQQWLSDYAYRISLGPWIFIASGFFCLLLSFLTVLRKSYQAANENPVIRIKTE